MNTITLKLTGKNQRLLLICFILFSLFISENVFAIKQWTSEYVEVVWDTQRNFIEMGVEVYDYKFGPASGHGYLEKCKFEASVDGKDYYKLMEITTQKQRQSNSTMIHLKNKLDNAKIQFLHNIVTPPTAEYIWPENKNLKLLVYNIEELAVLALEWHEASDVRFVRISGQWRVESPRTNQPFKNVIYKKDKPDHSVLKSITPDINAKVSEKEIANVFKDSEAIVVKGADLGANIKVYTASGLEIKSVVSNNDVVKIELPAKQIYIVHIGESQYKVAM